MKANHTYTLADFDEISFHDSFIHAMLFDDSFDYFSMDIDFILEWILDEKREVYIYKIAKAILKFESVSNLNISLNFSNIIGIEIETIEKKIGTPTPSGIAIYDFLIRTNLGVIKLEAIDFKLKLTSEPFISNSQYIPR